MSTFTVFVKDGKEELQCYVAYGATDHAEAINMVKNFVPSTARIFVDLSLTVEDKTEKEAA